MKLKIPKRGDLLAIIPLFIAINPLSRPRLNYYQKRIYQPKENQKLLLDNIQNYQPLEIDYPVIVDSYCSFAVSKKKKGILSLKFDEDNLRKAIMDALQHGKILKDDVFCMGGENYKWDGTEDCCLIKIWNVEGENEIEL